MIPLLTLLGPLGCTAEDAGRTPTDVEHSGDTGTASDTELPPLQTGGPILAGPGEDDHDAGLAALVDGHDRLFGALIAVPHGLAVSAEVTEVAGVQDWVATGSGSTAADLEAHLGAPLTDLVTGWQDLDQVGLYGGIGAVADVYRYASLRDDAGADGAERDAARDRVVALMETLHTLHVITGRPGTLARGLGHTGLAGLEDIEGTELFDGYGDPLPRTKEPTWRADQSGQRPGVLWIDDAGKYQWMGTVLAMGAAWRVTRADPTIPVALVADLEEDARQLGLALMEASPHTGVDLTLVDADGRHVRHEDLNATQADGIDLGRVGNPYNAVLSLSLVRTLATVSGDATLASFFDELVEQREYGGQINTLGSAVYYGYTTDYREVLAAYAALLSWLLHEEDPALQQTARVGLQRLWSGDRATQHHLDPWATVITAAWVPVSDEELDGAIANLAAFPVAPHLDVAVENCDDIELSTADCVAIDGVTPVDVYGFWNGDTFEPEPAYGNVLVATEALPQGLRPPVPFAWAADPYRINGGGSDRVLSGADLRSAYWLARSLDRAR